MKQQKTVSQQHKRGAGIPYTKISVEYPRKKVKKEVEISPDVKGYKVSLVTDAYIKKQAVGWFIAGMMWATVIFCISWLVVSTR